MDTDNTGFGPAAIAAMSGAVLSLIMNYIPGLNTKFDQLSQDMQRAVMGLIIVITSIGMAWWQCSGETTANDNISTAVSSLCGDGLNWRLILTNAVFALVGNQSTDRISPKLHTNKREKSADSGKETI